MIGITPRAAFSAMKIFPLWFLRRYARGSENLGWLHLKFTGRFVRHGSAIRGGSLALTSLCLIMYISSLNRVTNQMPSMIGSRAGSAG
jgi:hypothetical protein